MQTKLAGSSINACNAAEAVPIANLVVGLIGKASIASTSGPTVLVTNP